MDPHLKYNLRPVIPRLNISNTPKVFVKSNKTNNNNYNINKTPIFTYRHIYGPHIKTPTVNNIQKIYTLISPIQKSTYETNNVKYDNFYYENENHSYINDLRVENENINDEFRVSKFENHIKDDYAISSIETASEFKFSNIDTLSESNLPSNLTSESDHTKIQSQKENEIDINNQDQHSSKKYNEYEIKLSTDLEKDALIQSFCKTDSDSEIQNQQEIQTLECNIESDYEYEKESIITSNETQGFMEICITPPETSELISNNNFYFSGETRIVSDDQKITNSKLFDNPKEKITRTEDLKNKNSFQDANIRINSMKKNRFLKFFSLCLNCFFSWIYSENICEDVPQVIYYDSISNEKTYLIKKD